jgi:hypothetical protein
MRNLRHLGIWIGIVSLGLVAGLASLAGVFAAGEIQAETGRSIAQAGTTPSGVMFLPIVQKNFLWPSPLWRFGAAQARRPLLEYDAEEMKGLRLGWYLNWSVTQDAPEPYGIEYVPLVRVKQWKVDGTGARIKCCADCAYEEPHAYFTTPEVATISAVAAANPGMMWVLGNEIERVDWSSGCQDEILPELYAVAYHDLYTTIKAADPTAQVAIGGVIQATPLRLEYLTRVWDAYLLQYGTPMPVDVWNVHAFVLQEVKGSWGADIPAGIDATEGEVYGVLDNKDFSIAQEHIIAFRSWMKERGQQDKPLVITEYGVNMPDWVSPGDFTPEDVRDEFMYPSFDFFLNYTDPNLGYPADGYRLVQRWNWWSLDDDSGVYEDGVYKQYYNGNLFYSGYGDQPMGLSELGGYWTDYVRSLPRGSAPPY